MHACVEPWQERNLTAQASAPMVPSSTLNVGVWCSVSVALCVPVHVRVRAYPREGEGKKEQEREAGREGEE